MEVKKSERKREKGKKEHAEFFGQFISFLPQLYFQHQQTTRYPAEKKCMSGINGQLKFTELISC